jgi:hypothetical protein
VQAKFGQYLQNAKEPRSISQTEKAVEREQVSSKEQVLPMPVLKGVTEMSFLVLKRVSGNSEEN